MLQSDAPIGLIRHCFFGFFVSPQKGWEYEPLLLSVRSSLACSLWSQRPPSILHRPGDCLRKQNPAPKRSLSLNHGQCMKICTPVFRHGKGQASTIPLPFWIRSTHEKTTRRKKSSSVAKDLTAIFFIFFSFFYCCFCVLIIKNNNGLLSLPRRQGLSEEE